MPSIEETQPELDTPDHPGRLAMLTRAAYMPNLTEAERSALIRLGAPGWSKTTALERLRDAYRAHNDRRGSEARAILIGLTTPPEKP